MKCPTCKEQMKEAKRTEIKIGSNEKNLKTYAVDFEAWVCPNCLEMTTDIENSLKIAKVVDNDK